MQRKKLSDEITRFIKSVCRFHASDIISLSLKCYFSQITLLLLSVAAHYLYAIDEFLSIKQFDFCHALLVSLQFYVGTSPTKWGFCWTAAGSLAV